eukprot:CFRG8462T1
MTDTVETAVQSPLLFSFLLARALQSNHQLTAARLLFIRAEDKFASDPSIDSARDLNRKFVCKNSALPVINNKVDDGAREHVNIVLEAYNADNVNIEKDIKNLFRLIRSHVVSSLEAVWDMLYSGFEDMTDTPDENRSTLTNYQVAMVIEWLDPELDELLDACQSGVNSLSGLTEDEEFDKEMETLVRKDQDLLSEIMEVMDDQDMPGEWLTKYANVQKGITQRYPSVQAARRLSSKPRRQSYVPTLEEEYTESPQGSPSTNKKVQNYNGHRFVLSSFHKPVHCHHCDGILWGIASQGYKCLGCHGLCHKKAACLKGIFQCTNDPSTLSNLNKSVGTKSPNTSKRTAFFNTRKKGPAFERELSSGSLELGLDRIKVSYVSSPDNSPSVKPKRNSSLRSFNRTGGSPTCSRKSIASTSNVPSLYPITYGEYSSFYSAAPEELTKAMSKQEIKRQEIVFELIRTEVSFVRSMVGLKEVYSDALSLNNALPDDKIDLIFSNLDEVISCCARFCNRLLAQQTLTLKIENVATFFDAEFDDYKVFAIFCASQQLATDVIEMEKSTRPKFLKFLNDASGNPKCERYSLSDLMIMPMQRLTRYPLLIQTIIKATPVDHLDYEALTEEALPRVKSVCNHVNSIVTKVSNSYMLKKLAASLDCSALSKPIDLFDEQRVIVFEGPLEVKMAHSEKGGELGRKSDKKMKQGRVVHAIVLSDMMLLTTKKAESTSVILEPIQLYQLIVRDVAATSKDSKSFFLLSLTGGASHMHEFIAFSAAEKNKWISIIQATIDRCNTHAQTKLKGESSDNATDSATDVSKLSLSPATSVNTSFTFASHPQDSLTVKELVAPSKLPRRSPSTKAAKTLIMSVPNMSAFGAK